jgi:putative hemolysin
MGLVEVTIIVVMLVMNGFFAAYELALASVGLGRLRMLAEQRQRGAVTALAMKGRMEASLAVVQIGITLVGAIAAATGGAGAGESLAPWLRERLHLSPGMAGVLSISLVVLPLSAITIVAGELVPKSVAIRNSEWVCLKLSPAMRVFTMLVYPAVLACEWMTKALVRRFERRMPAGASTPYEQGLTELQAHARALRASRIIGAEQERIIMGSGALAKVKAQDIMVRAEDIVMLSAEGTLADFFVAIHLDGYTRFPVTERPGDAQHIIGYVNIKDIFFLAQSSPGDPSIRRILRPLLEVSPGATIGQVFSRMMREHVHLVSVRSVDGTLCGMITLEDILEEIVGDIQDEFDRLPRRIVPSGQRWIVGGGATLGQVTSVLGNAPALAALDPRLTFAEWLETETTQTLKGGDVVQAGGLQILVRKIHRKRVMEVLVSRSEQP